MMAVSLCSPWVKLYREIQVMFKEDSQVSVVLDDTDVRIYVDNPEKAEALDKLLNYQHQFGNIVSHVYVIPSNTAPTVKSDEKKVSGTDELFGIAFDGNKALYDVQPVKSPIGEFVYVIFAKEVVQYYNDDLGDANGVCSTLYQEIAKEIFISRPNLFYCTSVVN